MAMTEQDFIKNLKDGKYVAIGGARKALAKAHLPDVTKVNLARALERHFGSQPVAAAPKKTAAVSIPGLKKDGTPKGKPGRKPGMTVAAKPVSAIKNKPGRPAGSKSLPKVKPAVFAETNFQTIRQNDSDVRIDTVARAIDGLEKAHQLNAALDIGPAVALAGRVLSHLLEGISVSLGMAAETHAAPEHVEAEEYKEVISETADTRSTVERILGTNGLTAQV